MHSGTKPLHCRAYGLHRGYEMLSRLAPLAPGMPGWRATEPSLVMRERLVQAVSDGYSSTKYVLPKPEA